MDDIIPLCRSDIMQIPESGTTSHIAVRRQDKNYPQLAPVSSSTTAKGKWKNLIISIGSHCNQQLSFIFSIKMSSINTNYWPTICESNNGKSENPEHILEYNSTRYVPVDRPKRHLSSRIAILICQQQLLQLLYDSSQFSCMFAIAFVSHPISCSTIYRD